MNLGLQLQQRADGTALPVRVIPRGGRTRIDGVADGRLRVRLVSPPVDGAANKELLSCMARIFRVPRRDVEILHGETSRTKLLLIRGVSQEAAVHCLVAAGLESFAPEHEH